MEQMKKETEGRQIVDYLILRLAGISSPNERSKLNHIFRLGVRSALEALLQTMVGVNDSEDEDTEDN